jgi:hypothetical protein
MQVSYMGTNLQISMLASGPFFIPEKIICLAVKLMAAELEVSWNPRCCEV